MQLQGLSAGNRTCVLWITSSLDLLSSTDECKCQILLLIYLCILYVSVYTHANISNCNTNKISVEPKRLLGRFMLSINVELFTTKDLTHVIISQDKFVILTLSSRQTVPLIRWRGRRGWWVGGTQNAQEKLNPSSCGFFFYFQDKSYNNQFK